MAKSETRPAVRKTTGMDNYQVIQLYYKSPEGSIRLTPKQEELRERWEETFSALKKWDNTTEDVVNQIIKKYNIGERTVKSDLKLVRRLYEEELKIDWDIERYKRMQSLHKAIKDAHNDGDYSAIARLEKIVLEWKPKDLDTPPIDPEKIKPHIIQPSSSEEALAKQIADLRREAEEEMAEDAEYEEV